MLSYKIDIAFVLLWRKMAKPVKNATTILVIVGFFVLLLPKPAFSAVAGDIVINEVMSNPESGSEWVEIYNPGTSSVSLDGLVVEQAATPSSPSLGSELGWEMPITMQDSEVNPQPIGQAVGATDSQDLDLGEVALPPPAPTDVEEFCFLVDGTTRVLKDVRSVDDVEMVFELEFQEGDQGYPVTFTWDTSNLPADATGTVEDVFAGVDIITPVDIQDGSITISNDDINKLKIIIQRDKSWEMPITMQDSEVNPQPIGQADGATDGQDLDLGEVELPPPPVDDVEDFWFELSDGMHVLKDVRSTADTNMVFDIGLQAGDAGYPVVLTWDTSNIPDDVIGEVRDSDGNVLATLADGRVSVPSLYTEIEIRARRGSAATQLSYSTFAPLSGDIGPGEYVTVEGSGINNSGDIVRLKDGTAIIDQVAFGDADDGDTSDNAPASAKGVSIGRSADGVDTNMDSSDFSEFSTPTRGYTNSGDSVAPVITLNGSTEVSVELGASYSDAGATASDNIDGDITDAIVVGGDTVDVNTADTYIITYDVSDTAGNAAAQLTRTVTVVDTTPEPEPEPEPTLDAGSVLVNEIAPHESADWVEIYNPTDEEVDLTGVSIEQSSFSLPSADAWQLPITMQGFDGAPRDIGQADGATDGLDTNLGEVATPPVPPEGANDYYFVLNESQRSLKDLRSTSDTSMEFIVSFQPGAEGYPVTFSWESSALPSYIVGEVRDIDGNRIAQLSDDSVSVPSGHTSIVFVVRRAQSATEVSYSEFASLSGTLASGAYKGVIGADLSGSGDIVRVVQNDTVIDSVSYGNAPDGSPSNNALAPPQGYAVGRYPDGQDTDTDSSDFAQTTNATQGSSNALPDQQKERITIGSDTSGQSDLPAGESDLELSDDEVLDLSVSVSDASEDDAITVGGATQMLDNFTSGNLSGEDLTSEKDVGDVKVKVKKAVKLKSGIAGQNIKITNPSGASNAEVEITDETTVMSSEGWSGTMHPPTASSDNSGTAPSGFQVDDNVVEVGDPDNILLFDKPVKVKLSGVTGDVAYKPSGSSSWHKISTVCDSATNPSNISFPQECAIEVSGDTIIWTYHFTSFASLSTASSPPPATSAPSTSGGVATVRSPESPSVVVNSDNETTTSNSVTLSLSATRMSGSYAPLSVRVSNDSKLAQADWVDYYDEMQWTLDEGAGEKTVYAQFKNEYGISSVASDSIEVLAGEQEEPSEEEQEAGQEQEESGFEEEPEPQVLGAREYSDGSLIRGSDKKIYVISANMKRHIASLEELTANYAGQEIYDVSDDVIDSYAKVAGEKEYSAGRLIRGSDMKVYEVRVGGKYHIESLEELSRDYFGKPIYDVSDSVLNEY